ELRGVLRAEIDLVLRPVQRESGRTVRDGRAIEIIEKHRLYRHAGIVGALTRKFDGETCATAFGDDRRIPAMRLRDGAHDRESEPGRSGRSGAGGITADEAAEDIRQQRRRDPGAVVLDLDHGARAGPARADP